MPAALAEVRRRLGRDAVILHTRTVQSGGVLGVASRRAVEITAARGISDLPASLRAGMVACDKEVPADSERAEGTAPTMIAAECAPQADERRLLDEVRQLAGMVRQLLPRVQAGGAAAGSVAVGAPGVLQAVYRELIENRIAGDLADALVARIQDSLAAGELEDGDLVRRELARFVESKLPAAGPIDCDRGGTPKVVALVGATGVGKTTTVAKLAAEYALRQGKRVGLLTVDTYRIAAVDQLRSFADVLGVPLRVAADAQQVRAALRELRECDLILVDTAGVSPRDVVRLMDLRNKLAEADGCELHLVLSASSSRRVVDEVVEAFEPLGCDRVIFTKLDESIGFGVILSGLEKARAKLSYVTTGQDVPNDIEIAEPRRLARAIAGGPECTW